MLTRKKVHKAEHFLSIISVPADLSASHDSAWDQTPLTTLKEGGSLDHAGNTHALLQYLLASRRWAGAGEEWVLQVSRVLAPCCPGQCSGVTAREGKAGKQLLLGPHQLQAARDLGFQTSARSHPHQRGTTFKRLLRRPEAHVTPNLSKCCLNPFWTGNRSFLWWLYWLSAQNTDSSFPYVKKALLKRGEREMQISLYMSHPGWAEVAGISRRRHFVLAPLGLVGLIHPKGRQGRVWGGCREGFLSHTPETGQPGQVTRFTLRHT